MDMNETPEEIREEGTAPDDGAPENAPVLEGPVSGEPAESGDSGGPAQSSGAAPEAADVHGHDAPEGRPEEIKDDSPEDAGDRPECGKDAKVVGIRFPNSGKTYCFCSGDLDLRRYDRVVVESDLGINIGQVAKISCELNVSEKDLKPVLRKVTEVDIQQEAENEKVKQEAREYAGQCIKQRGLPMKLLYADVTLDRKRFIFYFVAETRIDFRELVKDLASKFRSRIELRQIGVRDAARMIGGFGVCGQELCCKRWLKSFAPISIKMAKQQDLVLNTCKLSGLCGRLMCCLNYEYDPNGPKRRKPEPRLREKPSEDAMEKAIESAVGAGTPAAEMPAARERREPAAPRERRPVAAERAEARPERPERPADKDGGGRPPKKRRRRGGRNRNKQAGAPEGAQQTAGEGRSAGESQAAPAGQPAAGQDRAEGQDRKDKPRRPRRRRRKPREKKPE